MKTTIELPDDLLIEAKKLAFADRARFYADPDFVDIPVDGLISKDYGDHQRARITGRAARSGDTVTDSDDEPLGTVTSGSFSPSLEHGIGLARVAADAVGRPLSVEIRGEAVPAETVKLPFVPARVKD